MPKLLVTYGIHMNSKNYKESDYGLDLDLLTILGPFYT